MSFPPAPPVRNRHHTLTTPDHTPVCRREPLPLGDRMSNGSASARTQWNLGALRMKEVLKVQQPVGLPGAAHRVELLVYNENRGFTCVVKPEEQPAHSKLLRLMHTEPKVFVTVEKAASGREGLTIELKKLPHQTW